MAWRLFSIKLLTWANDDLLSIGPLGTNLSEIVTEIQIFSLKKMHLKMPSRKKMSAILFWSQYVNESLSLKQFMMTAWDGNAFHKTGHLWGESTGDQWISLTMGQ